MKKARGFTLLELMIVVVIIAVLAGLAITGYGKQVRKSKRAEAKQQLSDLALRQEKWRANHPAYADCDTLLAPSTCNAYNGLFKNYTIAVPTATTLGFTLTATPKTTDQAKDACGTLTVTMANGVLQKLPTNPPDCW